MNLKLYNELFKLVFSPDLFRLAMNYRQVSVAGVSSVTEGRYSSLLTASLIPLLDLSQGENACCNKISLKN